MKKIQHISSLKLTNFKQFKELELDNIGQFNLIVGDNNVGKTSLLEALLVHYDPDTKFEIWRNRMIKALTDFRGLKIDRGSFLRFYLNPNSSTELSNFLKVELIEADGVGQVYSIGYHGVLGPISGSVQSFGQESLNEIVEFQNSNQISIDPLSLPLIPAHIKNSRELGLTYSTAIQPSQRKKQELISDLRVIVDDLNNIELSGISDDLPLIFYREGQDAAIPLAMYGEGTIKLARLLMELQIWSRQRLMIDEIDTGIYYKRMPDFWRTLISGAEKSDVQLFATTHNKDCLDAFTRLFEREDMNHLREKARVLKMTRLPDGSVKVYSYEFAQFHNALEVQYEIR